MSKKAVISIRNVSCIGNMEFSFELKPGYICLVGANGSGKTTLLNLLSRFLQYSLATYFYSSDIEGGEVSYRYEDRVKIWNRKNNRWIKTEETDKKNIISKGIYESGIVYGNRFIISSKDKIREYNNFYHSLNDSDTIPVSKFILEAMGLILKNRKEYYSEIRTITQVKMDEFIKSNTSENYLIKKEIPFLIKKGGGYITQYEMSSGEFMILRLLRFIDSKMIGKEPDTRLVLIDEVEIGLHPSAQKRLFSFFKSITREKNIFVIFSTHSQSIINICNPENIYLMENINGNVSYKNPCFPQYAVRNMYEINGYDYLIIVEDELARRIVLDIIKKNNLADNKLIHVMSGGGWTQIVNLMNDMYFNKLLPSSRVISVLDKDIKEKFYDKYMSPCLKCKYANPDDNVPYEDRNKFIKNNIMFKDDILFLPIPSLEKEIKNNLLESIDYDFIHMLDNTVFFKTISVFDTLDKYKEDRIDFEKKNDGKKYDKDGKKLWNLILESIVVSKSSDEFISYVCDLLMKKNNDQGDWLKFENDLRNSLNFIRN